mgnify:CR=1 FL=1
MPRFLRRLTNRLLRLAFAAAGVVVLFVILPLFALRMFLARIAFSWQLRRLVRAHKHQ